MSDMEHAALGDAYRRSMVHAAWCMRVACIRVLFPRAYLRYADVHGCRVLPPAKTFAWLSSVLASLYRLEVQSLGSPVLLVGQLTGGQSDGDEMLYGFPRF